MSTLPPEGSSAPDYGQGGTGGYGAPPPPSPPAPGGYGAAVPPNAEWVKRFLAVLIDGGIMLGIYIVIAIIGAILGSIADVLGLLVGLAGLAAYVAWFIYNWGYKQGTTGYTLGKGIIGIKLVSRETGQPVGFGMGIARQFVHIVDSFCYIGYLWPLWDEKRETFTDKILTHAVIEAPKVDPKSFIPTQLSQ
jgi:uncharacterized RDD family membrane protein YckC